MIPASLALTLFAALPAPATAPEPAARFRGPEAVARPLDLVLRSDPAALLRGGPEAWCPAGKDFRRWLDGRDALAPRPAGGLVGPPANLVWLDQGVVVMEDDGTLLRHDRAFDLEGQTVELTPNASGHDVALLPLAEELDLGTPLFSGMRGWHSQPYDLQSIGFPFGGAVQSRVWVTSTFAVAFVDPAAPQPAQYHLGELLPDRTPRVAPLQQGTSLHGWDAWVREWPDRVVFSWRGNDGGALDVRVQAVLYADGRIRFHYPAVRGVSWGAPVVVDGNAAFWSDLVPAENVSDPLDVTVPAPDGPAIDVIGVRGYQLAGSELYRVEVEMSAPLPAQTDQALQFAIELRDEPGSPVFSALWAEWEDGRWNWQNYAPEVVGSSLAFTLLRRDLPLGDDDFEALVWTAQAYSWVQVVPAVLSYPRLPPGSLIKDFSAAPFTTGGEPILEPFTLPELQIGPVHDAFNRTFGTPRIDGLAVYQNFLTDIIFYAGAWSTVGNAGADGIGTGNTTDPESPALLHMNALDYGWNSWDAGREMVLSHEFGHHWLYFPSILENGTPGKPLGDGHPAGWTHTPAAFPPTNSWDASCMGGSSWTDNLDGTFTSSPAFASFAYSWPEKLYLMGLAAPWEVLDFFYLSNSSPPLPGAYWPPDNSVVTATRVDVSFAQLPGAMGPRVPDDSVSRKDFLVPMVLVVRPGAVTPANVDNLVHTCDIWSTAFNRITGARATVGCDRVCLDPGPVRQLLAARDGAGNIRFTWSAGTPAPDDEVLQASTAPGSGFTEAATGTGGVIVPEPAATTFYRVVGRNRPDCVGP